MRKQLLLAILTFLGTNTSAQSQQFPAPGVPRTRDGKPDLAARPRRTPDGHPDLSGVYHVQAEPIEEQRRIFGQNYGTIDLIGMEAFTRSKYSANILADFKPGEITMTPEAQAIYNRRREGKETPPFTYCLPAGIPLATLLSEVQKIVWTPGLILIIHELDNFPRQIYTDGRKLPQDPNPAWLGYSVGRWEGDTLIVETAGLNDKVWLDGAGHPQSEAMHITERYRRRDAGHLDVEITLNDPQMYNKPFTIKVTHLLQTDWDITEYFCAENEKDRPHMGLK